MISEDFAGRRGGKRGEEFE